MVAEWLPDVDILKKSIAYFPETGEFMWLDDAFVSARSVGVKTKGQKYAYGYRAITISRRAVGAHRVAYALCHGSWPKGQSIDHINGDREDNRIANLRIASRQQQNWNRRPKNGKTLPKGVFLTRSHKFAAQILVDGKLEWLGCFEAIEDAYSAYSSRAKQVQGEFYRPADLPLRSVEFRALEAAAAAAQKVMEGA